MKIQAYKTKCEKCDDSMEYVCIGGGKAFFYCEMHYFKVLDFGLRFGIEVEDKGVTSEIEVKS